MKRYNQLYVKEYFFVEKIFINMQCFSRKAKTKKISFSLRIKTQ